MANDDYQVGWRLGEGLFPRKRPKPLLQSWWGGSMAGGSSAEGPSHLLDLKPDLPAQDTEVSIEPRGVTLKPWETAKTSTGGLSVEPPLARGLFPIPVETLQRLNSSATRSEVEAIQIPLAQAMSDHGISLPSQQAAFLAQMSQEGGAGNKEEDLYYRTAGHLTANYGTGLFPSPESEIPYMRNPQKLANYVYDGKNGNRPGTNDGWVYRGRGPMQVTGRANYRAIGLEDNPDALNSPDRGAEGAAAWWENNMLPLRTVPELRREQFDQVSRTVNKRGLHADERWKAYQRALGILRQ